MEFLGVMLFSFLGSTVNDKILGPFVNGLALAVLIYTAANISGGHLHPAGTMSTLLSGFSPVLHAVLVRRKHDEPLQAMAARAVPTSLAPGAVHVPICLACKHVTDPALAAHSLPRRAVHHPPDRRWLLRLPAGRRPAAQGPHRHGLQGPRLL